MMAKKLCIMVTSPITATAFLDGYLQFLRGDGWEVVLVCADGPGVAEMAASAGVAFEPLDMRREPSPLHDLRAVLGAARLLKRLRPDVLVYATPKASLVGAVAGWITRVPRRVYELWGLRLETASGAARLVFVALESATARLSTLVVANSASLAQRAHALRVDGGHKVVVLGAGSSHGVDAEHFSPSGTQVRLSPATEAAMAERDRLTIGFIGRIHPDKGIETLLTAVDVLASRGHQIQLLLVGNDEGADIGQAIEGLRDRVPVYVEAFTKDVRGALNAMDVLVLPSRREGFPNVVLEAAAMEVPSVVSDATGCRDAVIHGVTGRMARTGDAVSFADEIGDLLADADARERLGRAAREDVRHRFSQRHVWALHSAAWRNDGEPSQGSVAE